MKLRLKSTFIDRLERHLAYIAYDSQKNAHKFKSDLLRNIKNIPENPYRFRQSIYFEDENIRDLIYKGYCVVFRIKPQEKVIEIFGFTKYQDQPTD